MQAAFLPSGLVIAFLLAWLTPTPGATLAAHGCIPWVVIGLFLINGYQTNLAELPTKRQFVPLLLAATAINLLLAPVLGVAATTLLELTPGEASGLLVKSAVPSTLSTCIVLTQLAGGYGLWALATTLALNIIGVFTLPLVLGWTLEQHTHIAVDPLALLGTLLQLVLLPFVMGVVLRRYLTLNPQHSVLTYLPSALVISAVWMALSSSSALFDALHGYRLATIIVASLAVHLLLLACAAMCGVWMKLAWQAHVALIFTASQKTLPVAVSVLTALEGPVGEALLVCVLFHFLQLFIDSTLPGPVQRWTQRMEGHAAGH